MRGWESRCRVKGRHLYYQGVASVRADRQKRDLAGNQDRYSALAAAQRKVSLRAGFRVGS